MALGCFSFEFSVLVGRFKTPTRPTHAAYCRIIFFVAAFASMVSTMFSVGLCVICVSVALGDDVSVTDTHWTSKDTNEKLQLTSDLKAVQDLLDRKIWSSERHDRVVQVLVDQYHERSSVRDRRQTTECTCNNIPTKIECSNVKKGGVLGESYAANMLAGLTWVGIIAIGAGVGYWAGLGSKIKEMKGQVDADGDGKISLEEMLVQFFCCCSDLLFKLL